MNKIIIAKNLKVKNLVFQGITQEHLLTVVISGVVAIMISKNLPSNLFFPFLIFFITSTIYLMLNNSNNPRRKNYQVILKYYAFLLRKNSYEKDYMFSPKYTIQERSKREKKKKRARSKSKRRKTRASI